MIIISLQQQTDTHDVRNWMAQRESVEQHLHELLYQILPPSTNTLFLETRREIYRLLPKIVSPPSLWVWREIMPTKANLRNILLLPRKSYWMEHYWPTWRPNLFSFCTSLSQSWFIFTRTFSLSLQVKEVSKYNSLTAHVRRKTTKTTSNRFALCKNPNRDVQCTASQIAWLA